MNLAPAFLRDNPMSLGFAYSETTGERSQGNATGCITFARRIDDLRCNYRPPVMLAAFVTMSSLCHFISGIICMSSKKQMRGPNTRWRVAIMQNTKARWNLTIFENPRYSMGKLNFTVKPELPVSFALSASNPDPTFIGFINLLPKSFHGKSITQDGTDEL